MVVIPTDSISIERKPLKLTEMLLNNLNKTVNQKDTWQESIINIVRSYELLKKTIQCLVST
jgi:hypothetical protein